AKRVAYVCGDRNVGLFRRPWDRYAAVAFRVALLPLVGKRSWAVRPRAVRLGQRLTLLRGPADRRGRRVGGYGRDDGRCGGRGRRRAGTVGVARGLLDAERVADVAGDRHVCPARRSSDLYAAVAFRVALLPLVGKRSRAVRPRAVRLGQRLTLLGGAADRGR